MVPDDRLTYTDVQAAAQELLRIAGHATINELREQGDDSGKTSVNSALGMATRALVEHSLVLQAYADREELRKNA